MPKKEISSENAKRLEYLATFLKEHRINSGLTQSDFNLHRNTIIRVENGENITVLSLFEIADALDLYLSELFQDIDKY